MTGDLSRAELMMMTIADVIKQLVEAHEEGKDINLNKYGTHTETLHILYFDVWAKTLCSKLYTILAL